MIKHLIKLRFSAMLAAMTPRKKGRPIGTKPSVGMLLLMGFLYLYLGAVFLFVFAAMFFGLSAIYFGNGMEWAYFSMFVLISFAMIFIGSIFTAKSQIFEAKDNDLLLTMPIRPRDILASRMIFLLLINFLMESVVALPAFGIWLLSGTMTPIAAIAFLLTFLSLPFFGLAISCVFAWLISLITAKLPKKNLITVVAFLAFFFGYMFVVNNMETYFTMFAENSQLIADTIGAFVPLYWMGSAIANENLLHLIFSLLIYLLPFVLTYIILSHTFIRIVTTQKGSRRKAKKELGELRSNRLSGALLKREFSILTSSTAYLLNCGLSVPFAIIVAILAVSQKATLVDTFGALGITGANSMFALAFAAGFCFMNSMGLFSAPSLSLEGKRVWLIRSMPISTKEFFKAKLNMHWLIMVPTNLICGIIVTVAYQPTLPVALILLIIPALHSVWVGNIGLICNLFHVNFDWINEAQVVKQGANILLTMLFASLSVLLLAIGGGILAIISYWLTFAFALVSLALGVSLTYRYLMRGGIRRWENVL